MTIRPQTFYDIACDEPGCKITTAELGGDYSAWAAAGDAEEQWIDYDHQRVTLPDGTRQHYCDAHRKPECDNCDRSDGLLPDPDDADGLLCPACHPSTTTGAAS